MTSKAATRLAEVLDEQFRTKAGLARALGVSRQTVHEWITRQAPVPVERREQIAALLGVDRADLFEEGDGARR